MFRSRSVEIEFPTEPLRRYFRMPTAIGLAPMAELDGEFVDVVDFGAGGVSLFGEGHTDEQAYSFLMALDDGPTIACQVRKVEESDGFSRYCFVDLSTQDREALHLYVLECQKVLINHLQYRAVHEHLLP